MKMKLVERTRISNRSMDQANSFVFFAAAGVVELTIAATKPTKLYGSGSARPLDCDVSHWDSSSLWHSMLISKTGRFSSV